MSESRKPCVLIVDDELPVRNALRRTLQARCEVVLAATPEDALIILGGKECHLVISDVSMPPSDIRGPKFLGLVQTLYPDVIRLIMSADDGVEAQVAVTAGVAEAFLPKPFDVDLLDKFVDRAFAKVEGK